MRSKFGASKKAIKKKQIQETAWELLTLSINELEKGESLSLQKHCIIDLLKILASAEKKVTEKTEDTDKSDEKNKSDEKQKADIILLKKWMNEK